MEPLQKIGIICCLLVICIQDLKERRVYLLALLGAILFMGWQFLVVVGSSIFAQNVGLNLGIIIAIILVLQLYATYKLKVSLQEAFGLGDFLFFIAIAFSFPFITFAVLFSFSLLFSLSIFLAIKPFIKQKTVPLAGLQALFFLLIFGVNWSLDFTNLHLF